MALYDETAPWYDLVHDALTDAEADVALLRDAFARYATRPVRRVLDLGCGTGTHATLLAKAGFRVDALDASEGQLAVARGKSQRAGVHVAYHLADIASPPPEGEWDAVVSLNHGFTYVLDDADAERALAALAARVPAGGLLALEAWSGDGVRAAKTFDRYETPDGAEVVRLMERVVTSGVLYATFETLVLEGARVARRVRESHRMRARTASETRALVERAGWRVLRVARGGRSKALADARGDEAAVLLVATR